MESVRWMVDLARRAGVQRIILNGSFTTDIIEPNDVDCVVLMPRGRPRDVDAFRELQAGLPFLDITIARSRRFGEYVDDIFAADRFQTPKGMIEVLP